MKKWSLIGCAVFSNKSIAGSSAAAATAASAFALGFDVWPWVLGAFGASIVQVYKAPESRPKAIINSSISVVVGGVVSPFVTSYSWIRENFDDRFIATYAVSFLLAAAWPWVLPIFMTLLKSISEKFILR